MRSCLGNHASQSRGPLNTSFTFVLTIRNPTSNKKEMQEEFLPAPKKIYTLTTARGRAGQLQGKHGQTRVDEKDSFQAARSKRFRFSSGLFLSFGEIQFDCPFLRLSSCAAPGALQATMASMSTSAWKHKNWVRGSLGWCAKVKISYLGQSGNVPFLEGEGDGMEREVSRLNGGEGGCLQVMYEVEKRLISLCIKLKLQYNARAIQSF